MTIPICCSGSPALEPHPLCSASCRAELDRCLPLGGRQEHGPLLLAWLLLLHVTAENGTAEGRVAALTKRCRQLDVLRYTRQMLTEAEVLQSRVRGYVTGLNVGAGGGVSISRMLIC